MAQVASSFRASGARGHAAQTHGITPLWSMSPPQGVGAALVRAAWEVRAKRCCAAPLLGRAAAKPPQRRLQTHATTPARQRQRLDIHLHGSTPVAASYICSTGRSPSAPLGRQSTCSHRRVASKPHPDVHHGIVTWPPVGFSVVLCNTTRSCAGIARTWRCAHALSRRCGRVQLMVKNCRPLGATWARSVTALCAPARPGPRCAHCNAGCAAPTTTRCNTSRTRPPKTDAVMFMA